MITVKRKLSVQIVARGRKTIRPHDPNSDNASKPKPPARIPRIARLMALAIHYQEMLRTGETTDMIELSRSAKVSQPRMSQIMALNLLAPDIQTELLILPPQSKGKPFLHEKRIRPITAMLEWTEQRVAWHQRLAAKNAIGASQDETRVGDIKTSASRESPVASNALILPRRRRSSQIADGVLY